MYMFIVVSSKSLDASARPAARAGCRLRSEILLGAVPLLSLVVNVLVIISTYYLGIQTPQDRLTTGACVPRHVWLGCPLSASSRASPIETPRSVPKLTASQRLIARQRRDMLKAHARSVRYIRTLQHRSQGLPPNHSQTTPNFRPGGTPSGIRPGRAHQRSSH